jgi:UDP-N-acetylmuramate--alanine ligase
MQISIESQPIIGLMPDIDNLTVHIIGIGGIGMSAIAEVLYKNGIHVQGSDAKENENTKRLETLGIKCFIGHHSENIENAHIVAYSTAVKNDNVEYQAAIQANKILMSRHQILREIILKSWNICVSGMHGKTTTSSMIALIFEFHRNSMLQSIIHYPEKELTSDNVTNFIAIIGGVMQYNQSNVIAYDSFIKIPSTISVVTNISPEHLDYHLTFDSIKDKFMEFLKNIPYYGFGVVCIDDNEVAQIAQSIKSQNPQKKIFTYSMIDEQADYFANNIKIITNCISFDVYNHKQFLANFTINIFGDFNISNCLAAIATANELKIDIDVIKKALFSFRSTKRRFEILGKYKDAIVIDDYGHHPRELKVVIKTAKDLADANNSKLIIIFQPHRYTRLQKLFDEFVNVLSTDQVDKLILLPVYHAGEEKILGIDSNNLVKNINSNNKTKKAIVCLNNFEEIKNTLNNYDIQKNDIILFMGAGDVNALGYELIKN